MPHAIMQTKSPKGTIMALAQTHSSFYPHRIIPPYFKDQINRGPNAALACYIPGFERAFHAMPALINAHKSVIPIYFKLGN